MTRLLDGEEPWFFGGSSNGGQSGLSDPEMALGGGAYTRRLGWQFGVRDRCGDNAGGQGGDLVGRRHAGGMGSTLEAADWRIPPMVPVHETSGHGPVSGVQDRLTIRRSAFDRLGEAGGLVDKTAQDVVQILNPLRVEDTEQRLLAPLQEGGS